MDELSILTATQAAEAVRTVRSNPSIWSMIFWNGLEKKIRRLMPLFTLDAEGARRQA